MLTFVKLRGPLRVVSTSLVTPKLLAGLLAAGACVAQQPYEIGGGIGYGSYHNGSVISSGGTAAAGIRNRFAATAVIGEDHFEHFSGEVRYLYHDGDTFLSSGAVKGNVQAQSHALHYDALFHFKPRRERMRPFLAGGAGAKYYETTGPTPNPQPLPKIAGLTNQSQWKPLFTVGAGVKVRLGDHVIVRGDFRDYITVFPDRLFKPVDGATTRGIFHQFTPLFGLSYGF